MNSVISVHHFSAYRTQTHRHTRFKAHGNVIHNNYVFSENFEIHVYFLQYAFSSICENSLYSTVGKAFEKDNFH